MKIPRRALFGKLDTALFKAMESAAPFAKLKDHARVELSHWLLQFWQLADTDLHRLAQHHRVEVAQVQAELMQSVQGLPQDQRGLLDFSHVIQQSIEKAWVLASLCHRDTRIRSAWLFEALLSDVELRAALFSAAPSLARLPLPLDDEEWSPILKTSVEHNERAYDQSDLAPAVPGEASQALSEPGESRSALAKYCTDLTLLARQGGIDPVIGREHEIRTMMDILLRRRQNNPLLTGEAGVGKTAVVEGLALAIAQQTVPPALQNVRLLALDVGALLAGASMRGEFESRLKQLLQEAQASEQPILLFIDEIHTLVGAGGQAGTGDAANLLKPALARGGLRTIGATTWSEFKRHIEKDPALTRRFQVLQVQEPEELAAMAMVRGLVNTFAEHHQVTILEEAVKAAVTLSHRYIPARQLPDKAISLLDTACARVALSLHAPPGDLVDCQAEMHSLQTQLDLLQQHTHHADPDAVHDLQADLAALAQQERSLQDRWAQEKTLVAQLHAAWQASREAGADSAEAHQVHSLQQALAELQAHAPQVHALVDAAVVAHVVADWTGVPVGKMLTDDVHAVLTLAQVLSQRVMGQDHALATLAERVQIAKSGLTDPGKPIGTFMLVGPSGVGKTETALALAEAMYGGEHNLITLNMSEFQEAHTVSTLKGSPPGYVGYGEGGVLTEAVRRRPYSVILLDEVEKAHPDVHEIFYQVFDKGWMEDGEGRRIDFRNTLILLTSNVGAEVVMRLSDDASQSPPMQVVSDAVQAELAKAFPAAFLGRITVIPYLPLSPQVIADMVQMQMNRVIQRMAQQHGIALNCTPAVLARVANASGAQAIGGRRIAQHIEKHILPELAAVWLQAMQAQQSIVSLQLDCDAQGRYVTRQQHPPSDGAIANREIWTDSVNQSFSTTH